MDLRLDLEIRRCVVNLLLKHGWVGETRLIERQAKGANNIRYDSSCYASTDRPESLILIKWSLIIRDPPVSLVTRYILKGTSPLGLIFSGRLILDLFIF